MFYKHIKFWTLVHISLLTTKVHQITTNHQKAGSS